MTPDFREEFIRQTNVSRETLQALDVYAELLKKWNQKINLVGKGTVSVLWRRHFLDSAQLLRLAPEKRSWIDLGSGGGFPGMVVAIIAKDLCPDMKVTMVESDKRKAMFLRTAVRETGVMAKVLNDRIESLPSLSADILSARALAPLDKLLSFAELHLDQGGIALFLKGAKAEAEVEEALENWRFRCETYPSQTDEEAVILRIGEIERV